MSEALEQSDLREGYKAIKLGPREIPIPGEWKSVPFEEAIELNPKYNKPDNGPFDYLPMDAVDEKKQTIEYWTERGKDDCTTTWFKNGDTVYAKITPCTENGKIAFIDGLSTEIGSGSTEFLVFHPREGVTDERFVYYLSNLPEFRSVTISLMEGSTGRQRVPSDVFKGSLHIPLPPLHEQRRIADILSTVDNQIQQTDKILSDKKELRKGLVAQLIRTGLDSHDPVSKRIGPKEYSIADGWELREIRELSADEKKAIRGGPSGTQLKNAEYGNDGAKVYGQEHVSAHDFSRGDKFLAEGEFNDFQSVEILPDDILVTMMGTVGDSAVFPPEAERGIMDSHLLRIRSDQQTVVPEFLSIMIDESKIVEDQIHSLSHGLVMSGLNIGIVKSLTIPVPPTDEQQEFVQILSKALDSIRTEERRLQDLQGLKRGLMQDLLTGVVRVNTDN
ncbi:restriction endonuclease subunit S [Halobacteriales archaeon QS_9_68_17]|nr:MAG: restriction endonuclease subunit S [Halobacteriales archaeon QS_9_68_17]